VAITAVAYSFLPPRNILQIGTPIDVLGRRVLGPVVLQSVLDRIVLMAVRQQSV
jgi:hypothetical protein